MKKISYTQNEFDQFLCAYIECALWAESNDEEQLECRKLSPQTKGQMKKDCKEFLEQNYDKVSSNLKQAGHDFWLTRQGHGSGFWDGGWDDGDSLTEASHKFGSFDLYIGDDGKIYH